MLSYILMHMSMSGFTSTTICHAKLCQTRCFCFPCFIQHISPRSWQVHNANISLEDGCSNGTIGAIIIINKGFFIVRKVNILLQIIHQDPFTLQYLMSSNDTLIVSYSWKSALLIIQWSGNEQNIAWKLEKWHWFWAVLKLVIGVKSFCTQGLFQCLIYMYQVCFHVCIL